LTTKVGCLTINWMKPAGRNSIPSAFIINGDGKVAWIGHPAQMDEPLEQVVNGTWDLAAATETFAAEKAEERAKMELQKAYTEAVENDNWDMWIAAIDNFAAEYGAAAAETFAAELAEKRAMDEMRTGYMAAVENDEWDAWITAFDTYTEEHGSNASMNSMKFDALLTGKKDKEAAYAWAQTMLASSWDNPNTLNAFAWNILDKTPAELQDLDYALKVATRASELTDNKDPMILDTLARAYWELGEIYKAIAWQQKAVEFSDGEKGDSIAATLEEYETSLASVEVE